MCSPKELILAGRRASQGQTPTHYHHIPFSPDARKPHFLEASNLLLRLSVIAVPRSRRKPWRCYLDLDGVVLVRLIGGGSRYGKHIIGAQVRDAVIDSGHDAVASVGHQTTALGSDYLQGQIPDIDTVWPGSSLEEVLERGGSQASCIRRTQRIAAVKRNARLPQRSGDLHDGVEDSLLIVCAEVDARTTEDRPSGTDPDDHLSAWLGRFCRSEAGQRLQRQLQTLLRPVDPRRSPDGAQGVLILVEGAHQGVPTEAGLALLRAPLGG